MTEPVRIEKRTCLLTKCQLVCFVGNRVTDRRDRPELLLGQTRCVVIVLRSSSDSIIDLPNYGKSLPITEFSPENSPPQA